MGWQEQLDGLMLLVPECLGFQKWLQRAGLGPNPGLWGLYWMVLRA